jgi:hypothetical protein
LLQWQAQQGLISPSKVCIPPPPPAWPLPTLVSTVCSRSARVGESRVHVLAAAGQLEVGSSATCRAARPCMQVHSQGRVLRFDPSIGQHGAFYFADVSSELANAPGAAAAEAAGGQLPSQLDAELSFRSQAARSGGVAPGSPGPAPGQLQQHQQGQPSPWIKRRLDWPAGKSGGGGGLVQEGGRSCVLGRLCGRLLPALPMHCDSAAPPPFPSQRSAHHPALPPC